MLNGISPLISPDLLHVLYIMGHGDSIVLADAHFPGHTFSQKVVRADGLKIPELLEAILPLFPLDNYVKAPVSMMAAVEGDTLDPAVEADYRRSMEKAGASRSLEIERVERFTFYELAASSFAVVMTGETAKYGNILIQKGLVGVAGKEDL